MKLRRRNPDPTKKRTLADRLWRAGDAFVVTAALGGGWWLIANHTPNIAIPADAAPAKAEEGGGYARLVVAGREVVRPLDVDRALADDEAVRAAFPERRDASLAEREVLVKENGVVLAAVRGALRSPVRPSAPADLLYATGDDDHLNVRLLTRLLRLEAGVHEQNGDHGAAMRANLDAVQLGVAMQNRSPLLPSLVGMVCESVGRRPLWGLTEKLSAGEAREAVRRLEATLPERAPLAEVFEQEKWCMVRAALAEFRDHSLPETAWRLRYQAEPQEGRLASAPERFGLAAVSLLTPKSVILRNFMGHMDAAAATARQPYRPGWRGPAEPADLVNRILIPVYGGVGHKYRETSAQDGLLIVHLALRAYRAEHEGRWPGSLEELVGAGYLSRVPADPFAPAADVPLRYVVRAGGAAPLLYSIGPDGKDDGGTPLDNKDKDGSYRPFSYPESKGDMVVGINLHSRLP